MYWIIFLLSCFLSAPLMVALFYIFKLPVLYVFVGIAVISLMAVGIRAYLEYLFGYPHISFKRPGNISDLRDFCAALKKSFIDHNPNFVVLIPSYEETIFIVKDYKVISVFLTNASVNLAEIFDKTCLELQLKPSDKKLEYYLEGSTEEIANIITKILKQVFGVTDETRLMFETNLHLKPLP